MLIKFKRKQHMTWREKVDMERKKIDTLDSLRLHLLDRFYLEIHQISDLFGA